MIKQSQGKLQKKKNDLVLKTSLEEKRGDRSQFYNDS